MEMNALARTTRAVATLVLPLLLLTACSHSAAPGSAGPRVALSYCGGDLQARPSVVSVICTTDDITARELAWTGWGSPVAVASGRAVVDLCAFEDCHMGLYGSDRVVLVASKIIECAPGRRAYSRLQYVFVGRSPFQGLSDKMKFTGFVSGASRPAPPANQTVRLTC
jgi:hypothetical protein